MEITEQLTPFLNFSRQQWAELRKSVPLKLTEQDLKPLLGFNEELSLDEVSTIYLPLARLINYYIDENLRRQTVLNRFLGGQSPKVPYIISIAGSVAVGKSTSARILQSLLTHWPTERKVDLITTDGFLYPLEKLKKDDLLQKKGFPISYDTAKLIRFLADIKSGKPSVKSPIYSHLTYDIVPDKFDKTYTQWLENIRDWCISRQLWWGHQIPAYYCQECGEVVVAKEMPKECKCGHTHFKQDEDVLDTWFSSALWPFSTLGWPHNTEELNYYYPTSVLVTGYDIIFFWVVRMAFAGMFCMGETPFKHVLIHGLVRDSEGRKMSKSLGNGIDPLEVIDQYGADALRFMLATGNSPGNDMRFYMERVEAARNFANKLWNASRFVFMNIDEEIMNGVTRESVEANMTLADKWIISRANNVVKEVTDNMDKFDLGIAAQKIYDFAWSEYCDWYIEIVKPRLYSDDKAAKQTALYTLTYVLEKILKLLHPYMPFITEEIFCNIQDKEESIMISSWPVYKDEYSFADDENAIETIKTAVRNIRNLRAEMNVAPSRKAKVFVVSENEAIRNIFENGKVFFATLGYASEVAVQADKAGIPDDAVSTVIPNAVIYIPFAELVDIDKEIERLKKEQGKLQGEIKRCNGMLNNEKFVSKAPQAKIDEEKAKLEKYTQMLAQVEERLQVLAK